MVNSSQYSYLATNILVVPHQNYQTSSSDSLTGGIINTSAPKCHGIIEVGMTPMNIEHSHTDTAEAAEFQTWSLASPGYLY